MIGEKIYTLRNRHLMSQNELAEKLYVSRKSVSKWETNRIMPNIDMVKKLAEIFSVSMEELLSEGDLKDDIVLKDTTTPTKRTIYSGQDQAVFTIKDTKLSNIEINYNIDKIKLHKIEEGERITYFTSIMEFEIIAEDKKGGNYKLTFMLNADFDFFDKLNSRPHNITGALLKGETCLYNPKTQKYKNIKLASENELYTNPAHLWGARLKNDYAFLKLSIPEYSLFLWFKIQI